MKKWKNLSIQLKLIAAFMLTFLFIFAVNLILYVNINVMTGRIDQVYQSNSSLNELSEALSGVHASMTEYLNVKSSDTLESYYRNSEELNQMLQELNSEIRSDEILMMERNIRNMTLEYLKITDEATQAKRGRNIEKYRVKYEEAVQRFEYINTHIYSLNNQRFKVNTDSYEALARSLRRFEIISIVILLVAGVIITVLVYVLTRSITGPLSRLAHTANEVAEGNLGVEMVPVRSQDEVGIVATAFNQMISSIRIHMDQIRENMEKEAAMKENQLMMESHLKDAQLKYLQAQINPHFLFNTLNAGAQLAMLEGAEKTCLFVENMADFFRYNVKKINEDATLQEELELVDSYLYILNVRFGGEIHFRKQVREELLSTRVPSMILQPIVENAVNYGIRGIEWEGWIELSVYRKKTCICISIKDNGIGMEPEKIREILLGKEQETDLSRNSTGIGLGNVISRLTLYYNRDRETLFDIQSEGENKGTEVFLYLPLEGRSWEGIQEANTEKVIEGGIKLV